MNRSVTRWCSLSLTTAVTGVALAGATHHAFGYMGSTGLATGVHVHYEVVMGKDAVNPEKFILPTGLVVD